MMSHREDPRAGDIVPIPCRHCGRATIPFQINEGTKLLHCSICGLTTEVWVTRQEGRWIVKSTARRGPGKVGP